MADLSNLRVYPACLVVHLILSTTQSTDDVINTPSDPSNSSDLPDPLYDDWMSVQSLYCGRTCQNGSIVENEVCSGLKCFPCDCGENCQLLGTCCPSYDAQTNTYTYRFEFSLDTNPNQWYNRLDCRKPRDNTGVYLTVVRCPDSWLDQELREKCETPSFDSMESITPFTDKTTRLVFPNFHCAICNGVVNDNNDNNNINPADEGLASKREVDNGGENVDDNDDDDGEMSDLHPWELRAVCQQYQTMYKITDKFQFYKALHENNYCFSAFITPRIGHRHCDLDIAAAMSESKLPSSETCNKTNALMNWHCHNNPPIPALAISGARNMFCLFACQESLPVLYECKECLGCTAIPDETNDGDRLPPMYLLFNPFLTVAMNTPPVRDDVIVKCPPGSWRNNEGVCVQAMCPPGKILDMPEDSPATCRTAIPDIVGLGYDVNLILVATTDVDPNDLGGLERSIRDQFNMISISTWNELHFYYIIKYCPLGKAKKSREFHYVKTLEISITGKMIAPSWKSRDEFEKDTLGVLFQRPWDVSFYVNRVRRTVFVQTVSLGKDMDRLYGRLRKTTRRIHRWRRVVPPRDSHSRHIRNYNDNNNDKKKKKLSLPQLYRSRRSNQPGRYVVYEPVLSNETACFAQTPRVLIGLMTQPMTYDYRVHVLKFKNEFIDLVPSLSCPHVQVNMTGYSKLYNGSLQFTIDLHGNEINLTDYVTLDAVSFQGGKLLVCLDVLNNLTLEIATHDLDPDGMGSATSNSSSSFSQNPIINATYYMEIVCTCVSILSLFLTFLTYCLFPSLRKLPGRNNMCLCASLATAQTSLLVTSLFGTSGLLSAPHCLIHGIILHYSWLATFAWMITCCVHMHRVFTSVLGPTAWPQARTHRRYCLFAFGTPLLIVIATMVTAHVVTKGRSIGYNDQTCLIDGSISPLVGILTILTPFAITMIVNTFLFLRTVKEIVHVTRLQQNMMSTGSRQGVVTYFKLSTVTGVFYGLVVAGVLTSSPVLMLLATPLGALQGLFIFVSFTMNKTVVGLYKGLVMSQKTSVDSQTKSTDAGISGSSKHDCHQTTGTTSV